MENLKELGLKTHSLNKELFSLVLLYCIRLEPLLDKSVPSPVGLSL
jgi:hypothetical protein